MSSSDAMKHDPAAEKLGRFTPSALGLNRDAILFAAGQASMKRSWFWPVVAGILALSQAVTLYFFVFPQASSSPVMIIHREVIETTPDEPSTPPSPMPESMLLRQRFQWDQFDEIVPAEQIVTIESRNQPHFSVRSPLNFE